MLNQSNQEDLKATLTTTASTSTTNTSTKPFKMNTYIQLDIDQNNFNCLPRICKFLITKLKLVQQDLIKSTNSSIIIAVKLEASKRSLRTLEIPLNLNSNENRTDLNLSYNITYPHYLKKDSNLLYFYIQTRRKKYKTKSKTIHFGYKTLAYTFIDLAQALQKPFSNDLPLFKRSNNQKNNFQSTKQQNQIIGYLTVDSLTSQPINDLVVDISNNTDDIDYECNSDLDSDQETNRPNTKRTNQTKTSNNKNQLTGKIISFIRKLKSENSTIIKNVAVNEEINDNENSIINQVLDLGLDDDYNEDLDDEFYNNIEQVSDYVNSDSDELNSKEQDAYSIISARKPKIEPFFTQSYLDILSQKNRLSKRNNKSSNSNTSNNKNQLTGKIISFIRKLKNENSTMIKNATSPNEEKENDNSLILNQVLGLDDDDLLEDEIEQVSDYVNSDCSDEQNVNNYLSKDQDAYSIVSTPKPKIEPFYSQSSLDMISKSNRNSTEKYDSKLSGLNFLLAETNINLDSSLMNNLILLNNFNDLIQFLNENSLKNVNKNNNCIKLVIIGSHSFLNKFVNSIYLNFLLKHNVDHTKLIKHYYITKSLYELNSNNLVLNMLNEINIIKQQSQIGEVMLNFENEESKLVPFLTNIKIGFKMNSTMNEEILNEQKNILSTSSSLPHFLSQNHNTITQQTNLKKYTPPNSPQQSTCQQHDDFYNLQLDYWTMSNLNQTNNNLTSQLINSNLQSISLVNINVINDVSTNNMGNKTSIKALFKNLTVYPTNNDNHSLNVVYCIKEKKQKIMRLSKKSKDVENKNERVEGLSRLVCTSKNHSTPFNVFIDDIEYESIKFLQISPQWQGKSISLNLILPNIS